MRILAFDQATRITGWAVGDEHALIDHGVLKSRSSINGVAQTGAMRADAMVDMIAEKIQREKPDIVVLEGVHYGASAQTLIALAEFRGRLIEIVRRLSGARLVDVSSGELQSFLGLSGRTRRKTKKVAALRYASALIADGDGKPGWNGKPLVGEDAADAICLYALVARRELIDARAG